MEGLYQQLHPGSASDPLLTESFLSSVHLRSGYDLFLDEQMQIMHVEQCNVMHLNHDKNPSFL